MVAPALADLIDKELGKPDHARRCRTLRDLYATQREHVRRHDARVSATIAGFVYVLFGVTDYVLVDDVFLPNLIARLIVGAAFVAGTELLFARGARSLTIEVYCAAATIVAYAAWLTISSFSDRYGNMSYYLTYGIIFMLGQNVFFKFRFWIAALSSSTILLISQWHLVAKYNLGFEYVTVIATLYLATYTLTLFVNWTLNVERYLVFLNSVRAEIRRNEAVERGAALLRLSTTDALTGLANRRAIDEQLRTLWERWQSARVPFAVVLVDIDYFKLYNDRYGHQDGDRCLVAVAGAMARVAAEGGYAIGRFGGEEFVLVAPVESRDDLARMAETLRRAVEDLRLPHEQRPDQHAVVTISVGGALSGDVPGTKVERLISEADRALYNAKNSNRNCVRIFDRNDRNQLDLDEDVADLLRRADTEGLVSLVYQPIVRASSGEVVAAEALMRLTTPSGKSISPAVFIPLAERMGLIVRLGQWAIRTACRDVLARNLAPMVSVNVSAVQLRSAAFPLAVAAILSETGVAPHRLAVEVTESLQIEGQPEIMASIRDLRLLGVRIWLDDFGTGFAGLSCFREVDFDLVKIDRSFLHASATAKGAEVFRSVVELVRNAGCATVVEGVETEEQRLLCLEHHVDMLQGYHLGRPGPAAALPGPAAALPRPAVRPAALAARA